MASTVHEILPTPPAHDLARDLGGLLGLTDLGEQPFPLRCVKVRAHIAGDCCRTVVEQCFANPYAAALEAVHIFPLPEEAAVIEFELHAGPIVVRGECRQRQQAEEEFAKACAAGRRAALLTAERADVHTVHIANIPPRTEVRVRLVLVQQLETLDGRRSWRFPTVIAPRYTPGEPIGHAGDGIQPDTDRVPDASRLQPPLRLKGGTLLDLEVTLAGPLRTLQSSQHALRIDCGDVIRVAPAARATLDRDFVLWFAAGLPDRPSACAFTDGQYTLVTVEAPGRVVAPGFPRDVVLVIDVSGSMEGAKLEAARRAVSTALHGLQLGDRFRIIAFNDRLASFRGKFVKYGNETLLAADTWLAQLDAQGGTEMLPALRAALAGHTPRGRIRTVLFITDGQASNDVELIRAVRRHDAGARLFTVGIDTAVNAALLKRLARAGGGTCELLTPFEDIEAAIARLEARFGAPVLSDLRVEGLKAEIACPAGLVVFSGRPASFLLVGTFQRLRIAGTSPQGPAEFTAEPLPIDFPLGALWARQRVAWLEDELAAEPRREGELRPEILRIALQHGIASRFTAFVAVETEQTSDGCERVVVIQPVELPDAWSEGFRAAPALDALFMLDSRPAALGSAALCAPTLKRQVRVRALGMPTRAGSAEGRDRRCAAASEPTEAVSGLGAEQLGGVLARRQSADGSFGGHVGRTAAALVALVALGNTLLAGIRRLVVVKAAAWLKPHAGEPTARLALEVLEKAQEAGAFPRDIDVASLFPCGQEGGLLKRALALEGRGRQ